MYEWTDPDTGTVWQMYYDVPQGGEDARERVMYRVKGLTTWQELPPFATPPPEAMAEWFGPPPEPSKEDGLTMDDLNDLFGAVYRLTIDLKRQGIVPDSMRMAIDPD